MLTATMWTAIGIFVVTYIMIAWRKIPETYSAALGAMLMILAGIFIPTADMSTPAIKALQTYVDLSVIGLLAAMMLLVKVIEETGVFEFISILLAKKVQGNPYRIMVAIFFITAIFSAFLDNVTTVLLIAPVSILIAGELRVTPLPFLISQIIASNMGGTATLIGDPPNIMIGTAAGLSFTDFLVDLAPVIIIQLLLFAFIFYLIFRKQLYVRNEDRARIMDFDEKQMLRDKPLLVKSLIVFSLVITAFILHGFLEIDAAVIALTGSVILLTIGKMEPGRILKEIDWDTIFFFAGLFVLVGGLVESGVVNLMTSAVMDYTKGDLKLITQITVWFCGVASAIINNIPFVATMIPMIKEIGVTAGPEAVKPLWWALSLGACLGGNGTLIGASANVVVAGIANKAGHKLTFGKFLLYGAPLTILSLAISYAYLMIVYY